METDIKSWLQSIVADTARIVEDLEINAAALTRAHAKREEYRGYVSNAEKSLEYVRAELHNEQELLRELDKGTALADRKSTMTAGDKDAREAQFEAYLYQLAQDGRVQHGTPYASAYWEVENSRSDLKNAEVEYFTAERILASTRAIADLQAARMGALSKLV